MLRLLLRLWRRMRRWQLLLMLAVLVHWRVTRARVGVGQCGAGNAVGHRCGCHCASAAQAVRAVSVDGPVLQAEGLIALAVVVVVPAHLLLSSRSEQAERLWLALAGSTGHKKQGLAVRRKAVQNGAVLEASDECRLALDASVRDFATFATLEVRPTLAVHASHKLGNITGLHQVQKCVTNLQV
jgi:hypothetical protein